MKLFTKYTRINLIATIIIFLLSSIAFYLAIRFILINQMDDNLRVGQREIESFVKEHDTLPEPISVKDQKINYAIIGEPLTKRKFRTIAAYDSVGKENSPFRAVDFGVNARNKWYKVTIAKSLEGTDDLTQSILLITSSTILLILVASVIINRVLLKRLWKPFYESLNTVNNFKLDKNLILHFPRTNIDEFAFMNQTLEKTIKQVQDDYFLLKEFTENASHEMQTPLAIMRSKLDLLIQDEHLSENQSKAVQSAYQAIEKLTRLNHSLLLLAKIENNQYAETSFVNLKQKIEEKSDAFNELWQNQDVSVSTLLKDVSVKMNKDLADILLNNLLSNATRHNFAHGFILVELTDNQLKITNSSSQKELDQRRLYSRFHKQAETEGHNGLGLSIIKQICEVSGFDIRYSFSDQQHSFIISWA